MSPSCWERGWAVILLTAPTPRRVQSAGAVPELRLPESLSPSAADPNQTASAHLVLGIDVGPTRNEMLQAVTVSCAHGHVQGGAPDLSGGRFVSNPPPNKGLCFLFSGYRPPHGSIPLTLSRALTWAPRLSSCLRMSRCPPRQAQNNGVLSSYRTNTSMHGHAVVWDRVCREDGLSPLLTRSRASTAAPASSSLLTSWP